MLRTILLLMLVLPGLLIQAQSWDPEYFPSELMKKEGVEVVTEFETLIDDPLDQAGSGNRIRLARRMNYELFFSRDGRKVQLQNFKEENKVHDFLAFEYDDQGRLIESSYTYPISVSSSGEVSQLKRHTLHRYLENGKQDVRLVKMENELGLRLSDKIQFNYDVLGRLASQTHYTYRDSISDSLLLVYSHFARGLNISTRSGEKTLNRELLKFDGESRLVSREYFNANDQAPRYRESYTYSPRGWLEKIEYAYDWAFYQQAECVISRENIYGDHGKLSEAILDYGDGRRVVKFYDYSYYTLKEE